MATSASKLTATIAIRYLDAARVIHKNSPFPNALWEPLNHLFAMSAELGLKSYLEGAGVSEKEMQRHSIRHSLNALLLLSVSHGLTTTRDVAEVLIEMDDAHASHFYRYIPRPGDSEVKTVYSARPADALSAIQQLIDQCVTDSVEVRKLTALPDDWPPAVSPVHPVTIEQLKDWIAEKERLRTLFDDNSTTLEG